MCTQCHSIDQKWDQVSGKGRIYTWEVMRMQSIQGFEEKVPYTTPIAFNPGALTCGANPGSVITPDYAGPFAFTGTLSRVVVDLSGDLINDDEAELRLHMLRQ